MIKTIIKPDEIKTIRPLMNGKIGLIFGCFDLVHLGHLQLFRFAKKYTDTLIISLTNDQSITLTKKGTRPIYNLNQRSKFLTQLKNIDLVSPIKQVFDHNSQSTIDICGNILHQTKPHYVFTLESDPLLHLKTARANQLGIKVALLKESPRLSSTWLINKIRNS